MDASSAVSWQIFPQVKKKSAFWQTLTLSSTAKGFLTKFKMRQILFYSSEEHWREADWDLYMLEHIKAGRHLIPVASHEYKQWQQTQMPMLAAWWEARVGFGLQCLYRGRLHHGGIASTSNCVYLICKDCGAETSIPCLWRWGMPLTTGKLDTPK